MLAINRWRPGMSPSRQLVRARPSAIRHDRAHVCGAAPVLRGGIGTSSPARGGRAEDVSRTSRASQEVPRRAILTVTGYHRRIAPGSGTTVTSTCATTPSLAHGPPWRAGAHSGDVATAVNGDHVRVETSPSCPRELRSCSRDYRSPHRYARVALSATTMLLSLRQMDGRDPWPHHDARPGDEFTDRRDDRRGPWRASQRPGRPPAVTTVESLELQAMVAPTSAVPCLSVTVAATWSVSPIAHRVSETRGQPEPARAKCSPLYDGS